MRSEKEVRMKIIALQSTSALMHGTDTAKKIDEQIKNLKWVLTND